MRNRRGTLTRFQCSKVGGTKLVIFPTVPMVLQYTYLSCSENFFIMTLIRQLKEAVIYFI